MVLLQLYNYFCKNFYGFVNLKWTDNNNNNNNNDDDAKQQIECPIDIFELDQ